MFKYSQNYSCLLLGDLHPSLSIIWKFQSMITKCCRAVGVAINLFEQAEREEEKTILTNCKKSLGNSFFNLELTGRHIWLTLDFQKGIQAHIVLFILIKVEHYSTKICLALKLFSIIHIMTKVNSCQFLRQPKYNNVNRLTL